MRIFNPDKELKKLQHGNKNKVIFSVIALLLIIAIGSTYALYQVRYSKRIIYTKVAPFSNKDINIAVYLNNEKQSDFPKQNANTIYTGIKCDNENISASWNYEKWGLELYSELPNKCNVYFETRWKDSSGASYPELYQGLIPITIGSNGEIKVADLSQEWYNYDEHKWANAVLVTNEAYKRIVKKDGTLKTDESIAIDTDILQMYVWIPRYRYKLWNVLNGNSEPQMIEIEFESNTTGRSVGTNNGDWYTHPAFLFGDTELNGFWAGKFKPSDPSKLNGRTQNYISEITILPNKTGLVGNNIFTIFNATRNIEAGKNYNLNTSEVDTHMMKNMEWGAIAYLTSSIYGRYTDANTCINAECEVWVNNVVQGAYGNNAGNNAGGNATGCVGTAVSASIEWGKGGENPAECPVDRQWNREGVKASTTRNMYGIYDMSSTTYEYVMGVIANENNTGIYYSDSGFDDQNKPDSKYYDVYKFDSDHKSYERGHLGDATRETLKNHLSDTGGWHGDYAYFPYVDTSWKASWFLRGGSNDLPNLTTAGIFSFVRDAGYPTPTSSFRVVITAQDGEE